MQRKDGFTIVELIIVIVVIGILVTLTVVSYIAVTANAKEQTVKADAQSIAVQLNKYKAEKGSYPASLAILTELPVTRSSFVYTYNAGSKTYCLTASYDGASAYVTNANSDPKVGSCS